MKFTSSFAVLAVLVANGLVNATPIPRDTDLEIREIVVSGKVLTPLGMLIYDGRLYHQDTDIQDVWARSYDDEFDARDFLDLEEDLDMREPLVSIRFSLTAEVSC
jgi:hypothetical protein